MKRLWIATGVVSVALVGEVMDSTASVDVDMVAGGWWR